MSSATAKPAGEDRNSGSHPGRVAELRPSEIGQTSRLRGAVILLCVWVLATVYMASYLKRGWVPHDDGTYAQSAERVLQGELPHRDFDESYTGGLTFLNALAFRALGVNLASLRILLLTVFVLWVPCIFYVASRFVSAFTAGAITLLSVAWSVPNYPAAAPSWYNLFFAVFGIGALLRHIEVGSRRWLFIAGICGGFSILAKITGVYFVFAALLFFIFREQSLASASKTKSSGNSWFFRMFVVTGLILFLVFLTRLVHDIPGVGSLIYFVMPTAVLVTLLLHREFAEPGGRDRYRFANLYSMFVSFGAGIVFPIVIFLIPYWLSHSTAALLHDVFNLSKRQIYFASTPQPNPILMLALLPFIILISLVYLSHRRGQLVCSALLVFYLAAILNFSANNQLVYAQGWCSLAFAIPTITLGGVMTVGLPQLVRRLTVLRQQQIMLLTGAMALVSLVQFPFTVPVYFCYAAPLAILAATALFASLDRPPCFALGSLIVFYLLFAFFRVTPGFDVASVRHATDVRTERLTMARAGGLRIDAREAQLYEKLIPSVQSHADGNFIYAAPDCPEIYFLSGLQNPTRTFFDFRDDPEGRSERILRMLESHGVSVVAIDSEPQFSGPLESDLIDALEKLYPHSEKIGHFQVRWKVNESRDTD